MTKRFDSPTERFGHTAKFYTKYRPHYPQAIIELLKENCGLTQCTVIADLGSGTGIFTKLLLEHGNVVYGVEPNKEMRLVGEEYLKGFSNFHSIAGAAEATTLNDGSIDIITAAQAFHWFHNDAAKQEMKRILCPNGWVVFVWNLRDNCNIFMNEFEDFLIEFGTDYQQVSADKSAEAKIKQFLVPTNTYIKILPNKQRLDWEGFKGRILSISYLPKATDKLYQPMLEKALTIFNRHAVKSHIEFIYQTKCYFVQIRN